jgi:hypothetical protein
MVISPRCGQMDAAGHRQFHHPHAAFGRDGASFSTSSRPRVDILNPAGALAQCGRMLRSTASETAGEGRQVMT